MIFQAGDGEGVGLDGIVINAVRYLRVGDNIMCPDNCFYEDDVATGLMFPNPDYPYEYCEDEY